MSLEIKLSRKYIGDKLSFPKNYHSSDKDNKDEIIIDVSYLFKPKK